MTDAIGAKPNWVTDKIKNSNNVIDAVYTDEKDKSVNVQNFLDLMIQQLKNQDFMNPVDDAQYLTQMAQFATMQQMQDLAYNSKSSYMMSLVGKEVTVAKLGVGGKLNQKTGPVEKISFVGQDFKIVVGGEEYNVGQLMEVVGSAKESKKHQADPSEMNIFTTDVESDYAKLRWDIPTNDNAIAEGLTYSVYYSKDEKFDVVEDVKKGRLAGFLDVHNLTEAEIFNLDSGTEYFANVVVKDANGAEAVYKKTSFITPD